MPRLPYRGDRFQHSRDRVFRHWRFAARRYWKNLKHFVRFGPGAVAAAGLANYFAEVPRLDTSPLTAEVPRLGTSPVTTTMPRSIPVVGGNRKGKWALFRRVVRRQVVKDKGTYEQLRYAGRERRGKRVSGKLIAAKLLRSNLYTYTDRWQALSSGTATNLSYMLGFVKGAAETNTTTFPLYMMDLTTLHTIKPSTVTYYGTPFFRFVRDGSGTNYRYDYVNVTQRNAGDTADVVGWETEMSLTSPETYFQPKQFIKDAKIKMMIMGATTRPSRVTVQIVQFYNDDIVPPARYSDNATSANLNEDSPISSLAAGSDQLDNWNNFWESMLDNTYQNPLIVRGTGNYPVKGMRVLYTKHFEFNPIDNQEADARGHQVQWQLDYGINKVCTYTNSQYKADLTNTQMYDEDVFKTAEADGQMGLSCAKRGRVFLLIKGFVFGDTDSATVAPSFDISVRRTRQVLNSAYAV